MRAEQERKPVWRVKPKTRARARSLRREMTNAETKLWYALRAHRFCGTGFRRQTPIGPYIVDFVSHQQRLVIGVDGGQHFGGARASYDRRRDQYLLEKGFRVLRFSNLDVLMNREGVLETIAAAIEECPLPSPPPQAGEGAGWREAGGTE
jgi:very-short-patch-repair endonuclease